MGGARGARKAGGIALKANPALTRLIAAVLGGALLAWGGYSASRVGASRRTELRQAEATLATFAQWKRLYEPAVAAESIVWRRTWLELQQLGVVGDERLSLAHAVSRSAEAAGLSNVRVKVESPDTTGSDARLSTEGVRRQSAQFGLLVECRGSLQAIVMFLGDLPPSVAPIDLSLVKQDGGGRHRITLAVYQLDPSNRQYDFPTSLGPPLERADPGRIRVSRAGG